MIKKYTVYVIQSQNKRYYTGITENMEKRLREHNEGKSKWTKRFKDWKLVYKEEYKTLSEALKREKFIKNQKGGIGFFKIIKKVKQINDAG